MGVGEHPSDLIEEDRPQLLDPGHAPPVEGGLGQVHVHDGPWAVATTARRPSVEQLDDLVRVGEPPEGLRAQLVAADVSGQVGTSSRCWSSASATRSTKSSTNAAGPASTRAKTVRSPCSSTR
ncbi:hypothetical protein JCM10369A_01370 [Nocardioides pyridinolyticus]